MPGRQRSGTVSAVRPIRPLLSIAAAVFLVLVWTGSSRAQTSCDDALDQAQKSFDLGLLEDVPAQLAPCLSSKTSRATGIDVHSLLARVYLAADDPAKARQEIATILRLDSSFEPGSPPRFAELVAEVRREEQTVKVASVSKTEEGLREAPAAVSVLTAEEIGRRGYNDLEEMIHDLPGFDVARSRGRTYANIYQRGFRSTNTDRTLFLVDGVEQNDLWSNIAYISRQYPISDIERVEVVYGPASTIYGANAFAGVINVITKGASQLYGKDKLFGAEVDVRSGSWNTRSAEVNLAGRNRSDSVRWSLTGRSFRSDEPPISQYDDWNFDPEDVRNVDYRSVLEIGGQDSEGSYFAQRFLDELAGSEFPFIPPEETPFYVIHRDDSGTATTVTLTEAGIEEARRLDRIGLAKLIDGRQPGISRSTEDWYLTGRLELPNLVLGVQLSHLEEGGIGASSDLRQAGNNNISSPRSLSIYAKYFRDLGSSTSLSLFSRYRKHDVGNNNGITSYRGFSSGVLNIFVLLAGPQIFDFLDAWTTIYSFQSSTQLQSELTLVYEPSPAFSLVSGLELRDSSLQISPATSFKPNASEEGTPSAILGGSNQLDQLDLGLYSQLSYRPRKDIRFVAGGRFDYNRVRTTLGYGTVFNPRLAVVYSPRDFVFKMVYAEGFKTPSNSEKYGTLPGVNEVENPALENEKVKSFEASAGWEARDRWAAEVTAYRSTYSNIVALGQVRFPNCIPCGFTGQYRNIGEVEVRGVQAQARYRRPKLDAFLSYTFTDPVNQSSVEEGARVHARPRVGDIASHQLNGGLYVQLPARLSLDLRSHYVGARETGTGTTVPGNPYSQIDPYTTTNAALSFTAKESFLKAFRSARLQLVVNNVFDELYYDPGLSQANGIFAARLPQAGRSVFLRFSASY